MGFKNIRQVSTLLRIGNAEGINYSREEYTAIILGSLLRIIWRYIVLHFQCHTRDISLKNTEPLDLDSLLRS
jgi:hypothetical protein